MDQKILEKFTKKLKKKQVYINSPATKLDTYGFDGFEKKISTSLFVDNYKIDLIGSIKMDTKKANIKKDHKFLRFIISHVNHSDSGVSETIKIELDKNKWKEIKQILNDIMKY